MSDDRATPTCACEDTAARLARAEERLRAALYDGYALPITRARAAYFAQEEIDQLRAKLAGPAPTWTDDGDWLGCSTGAAIRANKGLLSLDASGQMFGGYDDTWPDDDAKLTRPEREALAEFMIARWRKWAADAPAEA